MKLVRYRAAGTEHVGIQVEQGIIEVAAHLPEAPATMLGVLAEWDSLLPDLKKLEASGTTDHPLASVELLAPVERPAKIWAIGLNYADHAKEAGMDLPKHQLWFTKAVGTLNGPFAPVQVPKASSQIDYEAELVIVIGKRCRHVPADQASSVIAGYCVGNDVSVRDWQLRTSQWSLGKSFDTHGPVGPCLVTSDAIDPHHLQIRTIVNGEMRQNSNTDQFVFNCFQMVEQLSEAMTLEPGDLIFTGTPPGIGNAMKPPKFLRDGDVVRVEIEGIGAIENTFVNE